MTILNYILLGILVISLVVCILLSLRVKRKADAMDGLLGVSEKSEEDNTIIKL